MTMRGNDLFLKLSLLSIFYTPVTRAQHTLSDNTAASETAIEEEEEELGGIYVEPNPALQKIELDLEKQFRNLQKHPELKLPSLFFTKGGLKEWRKIALKQNIPYLDYISEGSQERTMFFESSEKYDRWVVVIHDVDGEGNSTDTYGTLALILIDKSKPQGKKKIFFAEYETAKNVVKKMAQMQLCYECHIGMKLLKEPTKLRTAYFPKLDGSVQQPTELAEKRVKEFNQAMRSYGVLDWGLSFQPSKELPSLGRHVADEHSCIECHNGKKVEELNPYSRRLVESQIHSGAMPPDSKLTPKEQKTLIQALFGPAYQQDIIDQVKKNHPKATAPNLLQVKDFLTPKVNH